MNTPFGPHDTDPSLTSEERDLAQRLSQLGGQREPPPALDARILAAAHDAVQSASASAATRRRARRRWPVALGVAASLTLAVGIAWQLRPLPNADVMYSKAPATSAPALPAAAVLEPPEGSATAQSNQASDDQSVQRVVIVPPAETAPAQPARKIAAKSEAAGEEDKRENHGFVATPAAPAEPAIVFDQAVPVEMQAPAAARPQSVMPPPPPAPAPASAPAAVAGAAAEGRQRDMQQRARSDASQSDAAAEAEAASALDRIEVTGSRIKSVDDQPLDDQPPVSADAPQVRQAWLLRIRELVTQGKLDEARASLAEYRRRYPGQPLPDDLRALEQ